MKNTFAKQMAAYLAVACMAAQPAFAAVTDISNVPLGSAAGAGLLPNLLFILDDSGSMASDYNPDYVNDNNACMTNASGNTNCTRGDPPFEAGGANGFNGVGYDPNFTYLPGLTSTGVPVINPPSGTLTPSAVTPDAYLGGTNVNVTTSITDKRYCNANNVCKRSGADNTTGLVTPLGTKDPEGNSLAAGQFPYRANVSSASTINFGLPEMMTTASFARSGSTVTATTIGKPSLTATLPNPDKVYVTTGTANLNVTCATVTAVTANSFTYTTATSGTIAATTGSYRKCDSGTWTRSGNTVTVTRAAGHNLVSNDLLLIDSDNDKQDQTTATSITVPGASTTTFTYNGSNNGTSSGNVSWVRTGLYNASSTLNGPAIAYGITPVEWCTDVNLTVCKEFIPPAAPAGADSIYSNAAYVRFCKTQADAIAPGAVTGTSIVAPAKTATNRCQLKFVNQTGLTQYIFPRYGWFNRDTISATVTIPVTAYGNRPNRADCAGMPTCTYTEEIQNYSKWYAYYRTRMQMMKTSAGRSFLPFISNPSATPSKPDRLRVGFITINPTAANGSTNAGANVQSSKYLKIDAFNTTQASNWYNKFYPIIPGSSTPLRLALSRAGWIFAGKLGAGLTAGIPAADDPIQASCQRNYSFLTTDGFWNQGTGQDLSANALGNQDNLDNDNRFPPLATPTYPAPEYFSSRASGTYDGGVLSGTTAGASPGGSGTLADIAMYYYRTDLRGGTDLNGNPTGPVTSPSTTPPGGDVSKNDVPAKSSSVDFAKHQHMNTFTIGLADGLMRYQADYATKADSDFFHIVNGDIGQCFWSGAGACNWPSPLADGQSALDDLWHAAVNGRGAFYSAVNPNALATGLTGALNSLDINVASAAAAATSSPQVAQGNALAFSTTYQTSTWSGEVYAQRIDALSGDVITTGPNNGKLWEAHKLLVARVAPRVLKTFDVGDSKIPQGPTKLKDFAFASLSSVAPASTPPGTEQKQFLDKCLPSSMAQCNTLSGADAIIANDSKRVGTLVDFLSGKATNEGKAFRDRTEQDPVTSVFVQTILGDIINAQPVAVGDPFFNYQGAGTPTGPAYSVPEPGGEDYAAFKKNNTPRPGGGFLLVGANDGFLHAFSQSTGEENWAYAPRFLLPSLYQLADFGYPGQHRFYVDGTPEVTDVFDTTALKWKTIVVGGLNSGGRGYYALDITDATAPKGLWEFCSDSNWCPTDAGGLLHSDPDLGFTYGNPVIGRRAGDGRWVVVVTSGLNNVPPPAPGIGTGDGKGYFFVLDAITGQILHKVATGVGDTTTPSGLMKIGGYYPAGLDDPNFTHVYGGDQQGNVWRLDMKQAMLAHPAVTTGTPAIRKLATLKDAAGRIQPITARPAGTHIGKIHIYYVGTGRYIGNTDLTDAGAGGIAWQQSIYGIRDELTNADGVTENTGFTPLASFRDGKASGKVVEQTLSQSGADRTISKNPVDWTTQSGFFIDLNPNFKGDPAGGNSPGERVTLDVRLILGTLIVTSNIPAGGACVPGGHSFQYGLDFRTGGYVGNDATVHSGQYIAQFLVGAAIEQTSDGSIKALNKTITGENITTPIPVDVSFQGKRFSYRER